MTKPTGRPRKQYLGVRFGRLVVIGESLPGPYRARRLLVRCDCGTEKTVWLVNLVGGDTKSCGCLQQEWVAEQRARGEERAKIPEYRAWAQMIHRCTNPRNKNWKGYGGRGITVCPEWQNDYLAFLNHVGQRPGPKYSLDRYPNNDGNYEPGNVRWATAKEQMNNRRPSSQWNFRRCLHTELRKAVVKGNNAQPGLEKADR
jgi:hypothetical protein